MMKDYTLSIDSIVDSIISKKDKPRTARSVKDLNSLFFDILENPKKYERTDSEEFHNFIAANEDSRPRLTPSEWVQQYINIKGKRMAFDNYPYQKQVIDDMSPRQCVEKAAQLGFSQIMLSKVFWFCDFTVGGQGAKIIYTFPSYTDMDTYASARIPNIVDDSTLIQPEDFGYEDIYEEEPMPYILTMIYMNNSKSKKIRDTFLFLRGTINDSSAISIDSDWNIHDEVNFSNQNVLQKYKSRLGAATSLGWEYRFSTPTIPYFGVSKDFQNSDQNWWYIKCPHCGKSYRLEFERNIVEYKKGFIYQCHHCKNEITRETRINGFYVAEAPQNKDLRGYHVDKMCNPNLSATALMKSRSEYKKDADFYNFDLGLPYSERSTNLTREILEECRLVCGVPYRMSRFAKREEQVTMGVDQGDTLWIEVSSTDMVTGKRKVIYAESVNASDYQDGDPFQRIPDLVAKFNCQVLVIDALPNKTSSRKLKDHYFNNPQFGCKVYMAYYTSTKDGNIVVKDDERVVNIDRTETFKWAYNRINIHEIAIPTGAEIIDDVWMTHMCNLQKEIYEDEQTGDIKEVFVKTGPDHFNHAHLYCEVAFQILQRELVKIERETPHAIASFARVPNRDRNQGVLSQVYSGNFGRRRRR